MLSLVFSTPRRQLGGAANADQGSDPPSSSDEAEPVQFIATALHASGRRRCSSVPKRTAEASDVLKYAAISERATQTGSAPSSPAGSRMLLPSAVTGQAQSRRRSNSLMRSQAAVPVPYYLRDVIAAEVRLVCVRRKRAV
jgi:hypothetical protein